MRKLLILFLFGAHAAMAQNALGFERPPIGENQKSVVTQFIGPVKVSITYNSPNVTDPRGNSRAGHIWGELVPYGMYPNTFPRWPNGGASELIPWRAGSNENTTISFSHDVLIEGQKLPAGEYGLFVLVEKVDPWTIIFSRDNNSWGSFFYNAQQDALRIKIPAKDNTYNEWLTFGFSDRFLKHSVAYMEWENKRVEFKIEVPNVTELYLSVWRDEKFSRKGLSWENWVSAVSFCLSNNTGNWEEALAWANDGIYWTKNYQTLSTKARVLEKLGRSEEAAATWAFALNNASTSLTDWLTHAFYLLSQNKADEAFALYDKCEKMYPSFKYQIFASRARAYSRLKEKTKARDYYEKSVKLWPASDPVGLESIQTELNIFKKTNP